MRSEFENWFKTTEAYKLVEEMNYFKVDLFTFKEHRSQYQHSVVQIAYMTYQHQQSKIDELQSRIDALSLALDKIANPIPHMQKEADLNGCELNGYWAVKMSEDHTYSKDIARKALEKEKALEEGGK